ncbi:MAG TPA: hypothetical protein VGH87_29525, partial [Polyangiaceae bacterium]
NFGQEICKVDSTSEAIQGLVVTTSEHHVAYTFVAGNVVSAGSFAIESHVEEGGVGEFHFPVETTMIVDAHAPVALGEVSAHPGRAFEGETFHLVWPELGHFRLRHASLRTGDVDASVVTEEPIEVATDGSAVDVRFGEGLFSLAWHDGAHVFYGEGPTVRAAASRYVSVPDASVSAGPWIATTSKLVTWMSGANNVVRRAIVSCR